MVYQYLSKLAIDRMAMHIGLVKNKKMRQEPRTDHGRTTCMGCDLFLREAHNFSANILHAGFGPNRHMTVNLICAIQFSIDFKPSFYSLKLTPSIPNL